MNKNTPHWNTTPPEYRIVRYDVLQYTQIIQWINTPLKYLTPPQKIPAPDYLARIRKGSLRLGPGTLIDGIGKYLLTLFRTADENSLDWCMRKLKILRQREHGRLMYCKGFRNSPMPSSPEWISNQRQVYNQHENWRFDIARYGATHDQCWARIYFQFQYQVQPDQFSHVHRLRYHKATKGLPSR